MSRQLDRQIYVLWCYRLYSHFSPNDCWLNHNFHGNPGPIFPGPIFPVSQNWFKAAFTIQTCSQEPKPGISINSEPDSIIVFHSFIISLYSRCFFFGQKAILSMFFPRRKTHHFSHFHSISTRWCQPSYKFGVITTINIH